MFVFLLLIHIENVFAGYGGSIGKHDGRRYSSLAEPNYNAVVKITLAKGVRCTGTFISKKHVLTNNHCAQLCKNGCSAEFWNGTGYEKTNLKIVKNDEKSNMSDGTDWAILLSDKESNFYNSVAQQSLSGPIYTGGFGILRIISDEEISFLRKIYKETVSETKDECKKEVTCVNRHVEKKLKEMGKKTLFSDSNNFKAQNCNIIGTYKKSPLMLQTDCDSSGGDSGMPYLRWGQVVGLNNMGKHGIFTKEKTAGAIGVKAEAFYPYIQEYIQEKND